MYEEKAGKAGGIAVKRQLRQLLKVTDMGFQSKHLS